MTEDKMAQVAASDCKRIHAAVLFCDIRGFTQFFDHAPPDETFAFVHAVFFRMVAAVERHGGQISNFTGDGFLAQFNENDPAVKTAEENAVECALAIRQELAQLNLERHTRHLFTFSLGVGIHSGSIAEGEIKAASRSIRLILGDTVNTAARIENLTKFFSVDILISEAVEKVVHGKFPLQPMPAKELRGKVGKYKTFWVLPVAAPPA